MTRLITVPAFLCILASACASSILGGRRATHDPLPAPTASGVPAATATVAGASRKRVDGKESPATLVAVDRSRCTVPADRFRDIQVGDDVVCAWTATDRAP